MPRIHLTTPDGASHVLELTAERSRLGRAEDNDIVVPDGSVSSYHGEVSLTALGIHLQDRGSTNGTHVQGQRVESADVPWGGSFRLGNCDCVLEGDEAEEMHDNRGLDVEAGDVSFIGAQASLITGLGATPCPTSMRRGFGPKSKPKDAGGTMIMLLAVVAILACAAAAFMILQMTA
ncbi:MAG: FHA domain-containing protein [Roseimicrobium sp.]